MIRAVGHEDRRGRWIAARTTAIAYGLSWYGGVAGFLGAVAGVSAASIGDDSPGVAVTVVTASLAGLFVWVMTAAGTGVVMWRVPGRAGRTLWLSDAGGARACVMVAPVAGSRGDVRASTLGAWPRGRGRARELGEFLLEHHRACGERMLAFAVTPGLVAKYGEQGLLPSVPDRRWFARLADTHQHCLQERQSHGALPSVATKVQRENAAANAVVEQLTVLTGTNMECCCHDDGSSDGMHDFTISSAADTIALEVTTIADGERVGRDHRWHRAAPDDWVAVPGLAGCWLVTHEGDVEADTSIAALQAHLPTLEALGIERLDTAWWQDHALAPTSSRPPAWAAARALRVAGFSQLSRVVDASQALIDEHGGRAFVMRGFETTRPANRDYPVTFVTAELRGSHRSDVEKLRRAQNVTARHLWLWVEVVEGLAMLRSFEAEGLPRTDVDLEGIDGVWLGRRPAAETVAGYVWIRGQGWSAFSVTYNDASLSNCLS